MPLSDYEKRVAGTYLNHLQGSDDAAQPADAARAAEHTPGPLEVRDGWELYRAGKREYHVGSADGRTREERDANANHLAHCWNCHDELVTALAGLLADYDAGGSLDTTSIKAARAALAKAGRQ